MTLSGLLEMSAKVVEDLGTLEFYLRKYHDALPDDDDDCYESIGRLKDLVEKTYGAAQDMDTQADVIRKNMEGK